MNDYFLINYAEQTVWTELDPNLPPAGSSMDLNAPHQFACTSHHFQQLPSFPVGYHHPLFYHQHFPSNSGFVQTTTPMQNSSPIEHLSCFEHLKFGVLKCHALMEEEFRNTLWKGVQQHPEKE